MKKIVLIISVLLLGAVSSSNAQFSFGVHAGMDYGLGGTIRIGQPELNFEIGAGFAPIFVFWQITNYYGSDESYFKFYMSPSVGGAFSFAVHNFDKNFAKVLNIKFSGIYNKLIEFGVGGGVDFLTRIGEKNVWFSAGILYYPNAYDNLLEELRKEEDIGFIPDDDISAALANIRPYIGVTLEL